MSLPLFIIFRELFLMSQCRSIFRGNEKNHELLRGIKRVFFVNHKLQSRKKKNGRHSSSDQGGGSTPYLYLQCLFRSITITIFATRLFLMNFRSPRRMSTTTTVKNPDSWLFRAWEHIPKGGHSDASLLGGSKPTS